MANLTYTYTATVPQGTQQINLTQTPIENNFADIAQLIAVNHTPFNTVAVPDATPGLHNLVTYYAQAADPAPVSNAINVYSKAVANDPNKYELFYQYPNGTVQQLSGQNTSSGSGSGGGIVNIAATGNTGYQYISGGLLMKWGAYVNGYITTTGVITLNVPFPAQSPIPVFSSTPFHMEWQISGGGGVGMNPPYGVYSVIPTSATNFTITANSGGANSTPYVSIYWMAIGF